MALQFGDMIKEPASNKPTAGGTFNLSGTASSGFETFASQITSGNQVIARATSSAGQMEFIGTFTTGSPATLTVTTLRHSSTGSLINFSGGDTVVLGNVLDASLANKILNSVYPGSVIVRNDGTTTQSFSSATFTKVAAALTTEVQDQNSWWDHANSKFLPNVAGTYLCIAGIQLASMADGKSGIAIIRKNGTDWAHLARGYTSAATVNLGVSGACLITLNGSTDYAEFFCYQTDSTAISTVAGAERTFFMAFRVSD